MSTGLSDRVRARWTGGKWCVVGLVGALLLIGASGLYLAMINPPYQQDESSHVGYTLSLQQGDLPSVDTPVPNEGGGEDLRRALARPYPFSDPEIHVANNPPFPYLLAIPLGEMSSRAGMRGGPLFGLRMLDLAGAVGAVGCAFLLGRELGGGDDFVGLVTAGLLSGLISIPLVTSLANVDGPAFLATTGVTWALARFARTASRSHALHLGLWCAAAAAVRPMSLAFAGAAGVLALVVVIRSHGLRSFVGFAVRMGVPTVVLTGWFYGLNVARYGDPTGSQALFDKYGTQGGPSLLDALWSPEPFVQTFAYLVTDVYGRSPWWDSTGVEKWSITVVAAALVGASIWLALRSRRATRSAAPKTGPVGPARGLCAPSWIVVAVLGLVPMLLTAQHISGGGAGHARYLLAVLPIVASAAALVTSRFNRWLSLVAVVGFALALLLRLRGAGHLHLGGKFFGPALNTPLLGAPFRVAALAVTVGGALALVGAVGYLARGISVGRRTPT